MESFSLPSAQQNATNMRDKRGADHSGKNDAQERWGLRTEKGTEKKK